MKKYFLWISNLFLIGSLALVSGCKYDVAGSAYQPETSPVIPIITGIIPSDSARPGVNTITIQGQNFSTSSTNTSFVYFDKYTAEIVGFTATSITVRRPNYVNDSTEVSISSPDAWWSSQKFGPYRIAPVLISYCRLRNPLTPDHVALTAISVDNAENLFISRIGSNGIFRVGTSGTIDSLAKGASTNISDMIVGIDNRLYIMNSAPQIKVMALPNGTTLATWFSAGKNIKYGDFAATGYFWGGGSKTNFVSISPTGTVNSTNVTYAASNVLAVRVCSGYVYIAATLTTTNETKIYKHDVSAGGVLGAQQLVFDWSASPYGSSTITCLAFSSNGTMFVGTNASSNPLVAITTQSADYYYKSILPGYCTQLAWGNGNYLYMIGGNGASTTDWIVYRVDMGTTKASR